MLKALVIGGMLAATAMLLPAASGDAQAQDRGDRMMRRPMEHRMMRHEMRREMRHRAMRHEMRRDMRHRMHRRMMRDGM